MTLAPEASAILDMVELGQDVWHVRPTGELPPGAHRRGGIVYAIGRDVDENGELLRVFHVVDIRQGRARFDRLRVDEVNPTTIGLLNASMVRNRSRVLALEYAKTKGYLSDTDVALLETALDLAKVVT